MVVCCMYYKLAMYQFIPQHKALIILAALHQGIQSELLVRAGMGHTESGGCSPIFFLYKACHLIFNYRQANELKLSSVPLLYLYYKILGMILLPYLEIITSYCIINYYFMYYNRVVLYKSVLSENQNTLYLLWII